LGSWTFRTVPEELLECAELAAEHFRTHGFTVRSEKSELGFPYTPTLYCRRHQTHIVVEVVTEVDESRLEEWVAYGKSTGRDFRVTICVPAESVVGDEEEDLLRALGIGCYVAAAGNVHEKVVAVDLAMNLQLPDLRKLPREVRQLLGPAYEQFERAQWREGFEEACKAFEAAVRRYLKRHTKAGRILVITKSGPNALKLKEIDKMTMGRLARTFETIQNQNRADTVIGSTLKTVNRDRVAIAHHKVKKRTESRLRTNVGRHMWSLVNAMKVVIT